MRSRTTQKTSTSSSICQQQNEQDTEGEGKKRTSHSHITLQYTFIGRLLVKPCHSVHKTGREIDTKSKSTPLHILLTASSRYTGSRLADGYVNGYTPPSRTRRRRNQIKENKYQETPRFASKEKQRCQVDIVLTEGVCPVLKDRKRRIFFILRRS